MRMISYSLLFVCLTTSLPAAEFTVGAAQVEITPPVGCPMAGYYSLRGAEGTLDPLMAKAIVIENDGKRVALVALDLISTTQSMIRASRQEIERETGIPGSHVMISATHSHTGPVLADGQPRTSAFGGSSKLAIDFMSGLPQKIAQAVKLADDARQPARIRHAIGSEEGLAFNRRFHMIDGSVGWNAGKKNPKIVRPAGPTDPSVPLIVFESMKGEPIAVYVNFAMHLDTVGGLYYSADYPAIVSETIRKTKGEKVVTLFTIGTAGDINHINVSSSTPQKGIREATRIGTRLAAEVLRIWDRLEPVEVDAIRISHEMIDLPLAPVSDPEHERAKQVFELVQKGVKPLPKFLDQVQAFKALDVVNRLGKPLSVEVQVLSLGSDLAFVSLPGEIFVQLGLDIKRGSPFKNTVIAELANGSIGYVPNRVAYPQGNYEVVSARCASGSGELLVDSALKQLRMQFKKD